MEQLVSLDGSETSRIQNIQLRIKIRQLNIWVRGAVDSAEKNPNR